MTPVLAQTVFLGDDLLTLLVLAFGGALVVGNGMALIRPPKRPASEGDLQRAPIFRTLVFVSIGAVMVIWALASLVS